MACDVWNLGILGFSGYDARGLLEGQYRIAVCLGGSNQPRIGDVKLRPKAQAGQHRYNICSAGYMSESLYIPW